MSFLKELVLFIHPFGFVWLSLGAWLGWKCWRGESRSVWLPGLAWLVLTLFTCTAFPSWLLLHLEDEYPAVKIADAPAADVIVCLGGGAAPSLTEPTGANFNTSVDRLTSALGLLTQGKAPILVITGGGYPQGGVMHAEADAVVTYLKETLMLPHDIRSLGVCADTHDEAVKFASLAKQKGWQKVLLVTSATHMPRSVACFEKMGVTVSAVPCDYLSGFLNIGDQRWLHLPKIGSLQGLSAWLHEIIGLVMYRLRGWI
jgi:uncharacterized SAM-binding protein YcdF (DUF218 family)